MTSSSHHSSYPASGVDPLRAIGELICDSAPMWALCRDLWCEQDQELAQEVNRFMDRLCAIVHPHAPDFVVAPPCPRCGHDTWMFDDGRCVICGKRRDDPTPATPAEPKGISAT